VHTTGYRYSQGVTASHNEARMTPRSTREQVVLATKLDISPTAWTHSFTDYWGTPVTAFEIAERHERLRVVATSTVDVGERPAAGCGLSWCDLADPDLIDQHIEMMTVSGHVEPPPELRRHAEAAAKAAASPAAAVHEIVDRIREQVEYVPGSTGVQTRAAEVWEKGAGVCQDMVHLGLGALRTVGVPARYVSGYVTPSRTPEVGVPKTGESHAWLQYWDGMWIGIDPTNATTPDDLYVEVGVGRDYFDVPPLKGVYSGSHSSDMYVEVQITLLA
jgi:transglutaminase-like putative cysteine protease